MQTEKQSEHGCVLPVMGLMVEPTTSTLRDLLEAMNNTPEQIIKEMKFSNNADIVRYGYRMERALERQKDERLAERGVDMGTGILNGTEKQEQEGESKWQTQQ